MREELNDEEIAAEIEKEKRELKKVLSGVFRANGGTTPFTTVVVNGALFDMTVCTPETNLESVLINIVTFYGSMAEIHKLKVLEEDDGNGDHEKAYR